MADVEIAVHVEVDLATIIASGLSFFFSAAAEMVSVEAALEDADAMEDAATITASGLSYSFFAVEAVATTLAADVAVVVDAATTNHI